MQNEITQYITDYLTSQLFEAGDSVTSAMIVKIGKNEDEKVWINGKQYFDSII